MYIGYGYEVIIAHIRAHCDRAVHGSRKLDTKRDAGILKCEIKSKMGDNN